MALTGRLTGKEVGRAATTGAIALLLGLLVLVLTDTSDGPRASAGDDGRSTLEILTPTPSATASRPVPPTPTRSAATTAPTAPTAPTSPGTATTPTTASPLSAAPARTTTARPPATQEPVTVVVVTPTPSGPGSPSPTATPAGRVTIVSELPTGCGRLGEPCRYAEAPATAQLGAGPRSVIVTSPDPGVLRVTAAAGPGGSPASVGFVVRVCRCTEAGDDVLVEARVSLSPGSVLELQGVTGPVRIWVQELSEAGLSRGVSSDVPAAPAATP